MSYQSHRALKEQTKAENQFKNWQRVGSLKGRDVYHHPDEGWAIEMKRHTREMTEEEVEDFLAQPLRILNEYEYETLKRGGVE